MPNFQKSEANFSKPRIEMDTMFSIKVTQDPTLHFRRENQRFRLHDFESMKFLSVFILFLIPISQNRH